MYVQCLSYLGWINKFLNIYILPVSQAFLFLPIPATLSLIILPSDARVRIPKDVP